MPSKRRLYSDSLKIWTTHYQLQYMVILKQSILVYIVQPIVWKYSPIWKIKIVKWPSSFLFQAAVKIRPSNPCGNSQLRPYLVLFLYESIARKHKLRKHSKVRSENEPSFIVQQASWLSFPQKVKKNCATGACHFYHHHHFHYHRQRAWRSSALPSTKTILSVAV